MRTCIKRLNHMISYKKTFQQSLDPSLQFWKQSAKQIKWHTFPKKILTVQKQNFYRWFQDGKLNITQQCLDQNVIQRPNQIAYYIQSPITNKRSTITYAELHKRVSEFAGSLKSNFNIKSGDPVIIYMPMIIQSIIAILACARIGAPHVVVFGGFAPHELSNRIIDCNAKLVICANAGKQPTRVINYLDIVNKSLVQSKRKDIKKIIFFREILPKTSLKQNQFDFLQVEKGGKASSPQVVSSNHHLYYLYTSGTTGKPKGIIRDHGGTAVILKNAMKFIYNTVPNEGMFCTSDIGWVLGHSFIIYGPLISGLRSVLFQGKPVGTPNAGVFWQILQRNKINHLYTSPTAVRTIRKEDSEGTFIKLRDLSELKGVTCVGQRCDIPTFNWLHEEFPGKFINDCYWQTQTGSPILSNFMGFDQKFPQKPGSACKPLPGYDIKVINQHGQQCKPHQTGTMYLKSPLPPSFMLSILNNDQTYVQKYFQTFKGHYNTGDSGYYDQDGYFYIMSRVDDVINTAGHRLSTGQMEEIIMQHPKIAQAIVIGGNDQIKGQIPVGFVTIKTGIDFQSLAVQDQVVKMIREKIGPVASFKHCHVVKRLPKTRSGKYLRNIIRKMFNKQKYVVPSTVEDMQVVIEIDSQIKRIHSLNL